MALLKVPARVQKPEEQVVRFGQQLDRTDDAETVHKHFQELIENFGFVSVVCATLSGGRLLDINNFLMSTRQPGWITVYLSRGYFNVDPIAQELRRASRPFLWSEILGRGRLNKRQKEVISAAAEFDLVNGFAVPIRESGGNVGFVNIAGPCSALDARRRAALTLASVYLYHKLCALRTAHRGETIPLSPREAEILKWIAEGKSDWQIGQILAISSKTVNYHIENVKRKFGVATRMQAVVSALEQGRLPPTTATRDRSDTLRTDS